MGVLEKYRARSSGNALTATAPADTTLTTPRPPGVLEKSQARAAAAAPAPTGGLLGVAEQVGSYLPTAGMMAGGMLGGGVGPVSRAGSALFGAGGEAFNQLIQDIPGGVEGPATGAEATKRILGAGVAGAASQYGGQLLGGGATPGSLGLLPKAGRTLMRSAVGRRALESVREQFPTVDVINTIVRERLPWGRSAGMFGKRGSEIAESKVVESAAANQRLIDAADAKGITHSIGDVLDPVYQKAIELSKSPAGQRKAGDIIKLIDEEYAKYGNGARKLTTSELNETVKKGAREVAFAGGQELGPGSAALKLYTKWIGDAAQQQLERIPNLGTHIGSTNARTQSLMAARDALSLSESRGGAHFARLAIPLSAMGLGGAYGGIHGGGTPIDRAKRAALGVGLGYELTNPANVSRTALRLTSPLAPTISSLMSNLVGGQLTRREPEPQP